jgi:hypothetical protein
LFEGKSLGDGQPGIEAKVARAEAKVPTQDRLKISASATSGSATEDRYPASKSTPGSSPISANSVDIPDLGLSDAFDGTDDSIESFHSSTSFVTRRKALIVDKLMQQFFSAFPSCRHSPRIEILACNQGGQDQQANQEGESSSQSATQDLGQRSSLQKKRKLDSLDDEENENQDDDGEQPRKRSKALQSQETQLPKRLACPYFKRSPWKYHCNRSCTGPGFETVHRLK